MRLIFFIFLLWQYRRAAAQPMGRIFGWFLICIFGSRFFVEFLKEPQVMFEQTMLLNMGQLLSIPFVIAGIWLVLRKSENYN